MLAPAQTLTRSRSQWSWPLDKEPYDRSPALQPSESARLKHLLSRFDRGATMASWCMGEP